MAMGPDLRRERVGETLILPAVSKVGRTPPILRALQGAFEDQERAAQRELVLFAAPKRAYWGS